MWVRLKELATEVKDAASFLVTQTEGVDGEQKEALRRAGLGLVKQVILGDVDDRPQENSERMITSGGVARAVAGKGDNLYFDPETALLYLTSEREIIGDGIKVATSGWIFKNITAGAACPISFIWPSLEDELATGQGTLRLTVNGALKHTAQVDQGR